MDCSVFNDISVLPNDVFSLSHDEFYGMIQKLAGEQMVHILKVQLISSTQSLLRTTNVFEIFDINCPTLSKIRKESCFQLDDGSFVVKSGLKNNLDYLLSLLKSKQQQLLMENNDDGDDNNSDKNYQQLLHNLVKRYPLLKSLVTWYELNENKDTNLEQSFLPELINNITSNISRSHNAYRYSDSVRRFAMALYVLGGKITYEFVRTNLTGALPNLITLKTYITHADLKLIEGEFRFDSLLQHFNSINTKHCFGSEDCTGVIRKIKYDKDTNTFVGFSTPLNNGIPTVKYFQTESLEHLKTWFRMIEKAPLLNVHMVQPVVEFMGQSSPFLISAYGVNSRYTSIDIIRRWSFIHEECSKKGIRMIGFSTGMFKFSLFIVFSIIENRSLFSFYLRLRQQIFKSYAFDIGIFRRSSKRSII